MKRNMFKNLAMVGIVLTIIVIIIGIVSLIIGFIDYAGDDAVWVCPLAVIAVAFMCCLFLIEYYKAR